MSRFIKRSTVATLLLAAISGGVLAAPAPTTVPPTEAISFVAAAAQAGQMEVEAAKHALATSTSDAVKTFAQKMVTDHGKIHADLMAVAKPKDIAVPATLNAEQAKALELLRGQSGKAFDTAYAAQMVRDHAKAVELFQANATQPDGELAAFAGRNLPTLLEHRRLADNLSANIKADPKK